MAEDMHDESLLDILKRLGIAFMMGAGLTMMIIGLAGLLHR